jgi:hypothetical protein
MKTSYTVYATSMLGWWTYFLGVILMIVLILPAIAVSQLSSYTNPSSVTLGAASTFGALAYSGITTAGSYTVNGDIGSSTATIGGGITAGAGGTKYVVGVQSVLDAETGLGTALANVTNLTNYPSDFTIAGDALGGLTLYKGIYDGGSLDLTGTLILSGSATDVFIIRASSTLTINSSSLVSLIGGAVWSNVFWYVGSSATIYSGATFNGIILAVSDITLNASATLVTARLLANTGAVTINSDVLPVELASFTATGTRNGTVLAWKTATEKNNYGFNIERRTVGSNVWNNVGFVAGHGTSNVMNSYNYADANITAGSYAYRVAQVDNDGVVKTYNESEVTVGAAAKVLTLSNYPNPFNPTTTFEFSVPNDGMTTVKIFNVLGQEVVTAFSGEVKAGQFNHATFDGSKFSSGVYFYSVENNGQRIIKKMLMMK